MIGALAPAGPEAIASFLVAQCYLKGFQVNTVENYPV